MQRLRQILLALTGLTLAACGAPAAAPGPIPAVERIAAECALLAEAARRDPTLHDGAQEGCGGTARDLRPLAEQSASLRTANAAPLPEGVQAGSRGETVFRRLITRGVAPEVAAGLVTLPAFARATL